MPCPSDDIVLAFIDGGLSEEQITEVVSHLDACAECRALMSNLARTASSPGDADRSLGDNV